MKPNNNIEEQIREQMNAREIQPSIQAWDRLDAMLSVAEEKKTRRLAVPLRSIGIAAAVLVFATLGTLWYTHTENPKADGTGVAVKDSTEKEQAAGSNTIENDATTAIKPEALPQQNVQVAETVNTTAPTQGRKESARSQTNDRAYQKTTNNQDAVVKNQQSPLVNQKAIVQTNQEAVAQNMPNTEKTDQPLPKLNVGTEQAVAQNEKAASKVKVSANSLLSEVDGELELSFREKVLKKVSKNYKEAKVALANRNYN